jgi:hypothetical protein|tara:strand:+ start:2040 stop:2537 length:498 start_codon:yes stop_codon:yes gene_type:complete
MSDILFASPQEMTRATIIGGNVDVDKYIMYIENTQIRVIRPLLGSLLYDKIILDSQNNTLAGLYLELVTKYVKPITLYESCADFIALSPYTLSNAGLYKNNPENIQIVDKKEVDMLSEKHSSTAQIYINDFERWIELNKINIPEYIQEQTGIKPTDVNVNNGWYF